MRLYFDYYCTHAHVIYTYMHIDGFFLFFFFFSIFREICIYIYVCRVFKQRMFQKGEKNKDCNEGKR